MSKNNQTKKAKHKRRQYLPKNDPDYSVTPFDDVLRTGMQTLHRRIILLMNRIFRTSFTGDEEIDLKPTEKFLLKLDGSKLRKMDAHFTVVDAEGNRFIFHLECQANPDGSILLRFAEYDLQAALDSGITDELGLRHLYLPRSVLLNLRKPAKPEPLVFTRLWFTGLRN